MKILKLLVVASIILGSCAYLYADEPIDINGDFARCTNPPFPNGWAPNKPGYWEDTNNIERHPIEGKDGFSLLLTSGQKPIHVYSKRIEVSEGQIYIVKAKVKGTGSGGLGVYYYGPCAPVYTKFEASSDWQEIVAELKVPAYIAMPEGPEPVTKMAALLVVTPESSIEFSDVSVALVD